ncbi:MAG: Phosphatidylserine/phosphatidylglycerophosphate/cardiolipin synthase-like protein [Planctomycetota bacterium]|nr:Phosphatidylserine/phosphatidylglycerophosphate/cardiolipin synthase-like protein [Planctomycetota bacterium]
MRRMRRWLGAGLVLTTIASAQAGGRPRRELPANAVQPPGSHFEEDVTWQQKVLLVGDALRATVAATVRDPIGSTCNGADRFARRLGVRITESVPLRSILPSNQSPEAGGPKTPARLSPLYSSESAYGALLDLIAGSRCRIDLMMFGWDDDDAGRAVAGALIARARDGVLVRILIDRGGYVSGVGNAHVPQGHPTFLDRLKAESNIRVIEAPDPCFRFDHRKLVVSDDRIAWSGGMILTAAAVHKWHNFAFLAEGEIVHQYAAVFSERWEELGGCRATRCPEAETTHSASPNAAVRMVRTDVDERSLKEAVYGAVDTARHHIYIQNCYFSDQILVKKLVAARARGVDVRAVLTMRGDVGVFNRYTALTANRLLRGGARVYVYPAMTHVKAMSVDGMWTYIGTGNFDELSLRNNREIGLTVRGPSLVQEIEAKLFLQDMAASEELRALLPPPRGRLLLEAASIWF